jgi:protein-arginine kinase activator protein McsA
MKQCKKCNQTKSLLEFTKNKREKDGYRRVCRNCSSSYEKDRYHKNSSIRIVHAAGKEKRIHRNRMFIFEYLKSHPCIDCPESDPVVLEFDHINNDKEYNISSLVACGYSLAKIKKEIKKCKVRCANCHRRKTMNQFDWYNKSDPSLSESHKKRKLLKKIRKNMILGIRGSDVKSSKLKEHQVIEIKLLLKSGKTATEIAHIFNMSVKSVCNIKNNKSWKHVII